MFFEDIPGLLGRIASLEERWEVENAGSSRPLLRKARRLVGMAYRRNGYVDFNHRDEDVPGVVVGEDNLARLTTLCVHEAQAGVPRVVASGSLIQGFPFRHIVPEAEQMIADYCEIPLADVSREVYTICLLAVEPGNRSEKLLFFLVCRELVKMIFAHSTRIVAFIHPGHKKIYKCLGFVEVGTPPKNQEHLLKEGVLLVYDPQKKSGVLEVLRPGYADIACTCADAGSGAA